MNNNSQVTSSTSQRKRTFASKIDGQNLKSLLEASLTWLRTNQQTVNALNVFPVPDGDTGTNMVLTMQAAYNEIANMKETNVGEIARAIAQGSLMGARGNSGVILSQLWRGFARAMDNHQYMDAALFVKALAEARDTAYKGVVRPVEGTILTVAKDIASASQKILAETNDFVELLTQVVSAADESVKHTPELLPLLKQAGVVDSGGKGLFFILEGMLRHIQGEPLGTPLVSVQPISIMNLDNAMETIEPGQDYEVVIDFKPFSPLNLENYYDSLSQIGTSIQVGEGEGMYRMHIHVPTDKRYEPIDYTMTLGTVTNVQIENLMAQTAEISTKSTPPLELAEVQPDQIAVVAVSPGHGITRIFASLGVAAVVEGGQSMNPSTEEILAAFENLPTDKIIILPNNKNIIMAAQATINMSVKNVAIIPSVNVPQGLSAILRLMPDGDFDQIVSAMTEALNDVETGEITTATRTVEINGVKVQEGQVIVLHNGKLVKSTSSLEKACMSLLENSNMDDKERITLFYGDNITPNQVDEIVNIINETYPDHEVEIHEGGQPYYQFIVSIE